MDQDSLHHSTYITMPFDRVIVRYDPDATIVAAEPHRNGEYLIRVSPATHPFEFNGRASSWEDTSFSIRGSAKTYRRARMIEQAETAEHARLIAQAENDGAAEWVLDHYKGC